MVKEFAVKSVIDISRLEGQSDSKPRQRSMLRRLPRGEISAPADPPPHMIKEEWAKMVQSGKLSLGIPCVPFKLVKFTPKDGELIRREISIIGRKIPLQEVRAKLLRKHEMYMRLNEDAEIDKMTVPEMQSLLVTCNHPIIPNSTPDQLRSTLRKIQRTRTLVLWHDHGVLLGLGCILMTIHIAYDPAIFYTPQECKEKFGKPIQVQSTIERPELYILAAGSSSSEDQAALIQDRLDCLPDLSLPTNATNGVPVEDKLVFFIGDHPAQQYERGTQHGGTYKCACACKQSMFEDFAHTVHCEWRSLPEIQKIATAGKYGKQPGKLKPLENLLIAQLREELHARGIHDTDMLKPQLQAKLTNILMGIQRVPTLVLLNPCQDLTSLRLKDYTVLDCEPLHDIKGHFGNLFKELPHILPPELRSSCKEVIEANMKDNMTGAAYRLMSIELFLHAKKADADSSILLLLETAVRMSELIYSIDEKRTPRLVLQLYNCTWLHHALCSELFPSFHGDLNRNKFFGSYLHSLVVHAPIQLEIISLRSVNTENQERYFNQARRAATNASN